MSDERTAFIDSVRNIISEYGAAIPDGNWVVIHNNGRGGLASYMVQHFDSRPRYVPFRGIAILVDDVLYDLDPQPAPAEREVSK